MNKAIQEQIAQAKERTKTPMISRSTVSVEQILEEIPTGTVGTYIQELAGIHLIHSATKNPLGNIEFIPCIAKEIHYTIGQYSSKRVVSFGEIQDGRWVHVKGYHVQTESVVDTETRERITKVSLDKDGNPIPIYQKDGKGETIMDEETGQPLMAELQVWVLSSRTGYNNKKENQEVALYPSRNVPLKQAIAVDSGTGLVTDSSRGNNKNQNSFPIPDWTRMDGFEKVLEAPIKGYRLIDNPVLTEFVEGHLKSLTEQSSSSSEGGLSAVLDNDDPFSSK